MSDLCRPIASEVIGAEITFFEDLTTYDAIYEALQPIIDKVWRHCQSAGARGRTVTLKVKYADSTSSRARSVCGAIASREELEADSVDLLKKLIPLPKAVRLLCVSISGFTDEAEGGAPQMTPALSCVQLLKSMQVGRVEFRNEYCFSPDGPVTASKNEFRYLRGDIVIELSSHCQHTRKRNQREAGPREKCTLWPGDIPERAGDYTRGEHRKAT